MVEIVELGDVIKVGAVFGGDGKIRPVWFAWRGRRLVVERVNYVWQERDGAVRIYHYAVKVGGTVYEMSLDSRCFTWRLLRSYVE